MQDLPPLLPITKKTAKMDFFFFASKKKKKGNLTDETTIPEWKRSIYAK